jgi:pimeloyl-ACP methyl ester carboxylesterase
MVVNQYFTRFLLFVLGSLSFSVATAQTMDTVSIQFPDGQLEGTLSIADSDEKTPVVYIIAGSGPNDRDGNQPSMKSNAHLMVSDALLSEGISTLRVDKRMSGNSIFEKKSEEDVTFDFFVEDAKRWVDYLDSLNIFSDIILIGHSQGSLVAILAAQNNEKINGVISLAGAGSPIDQILRKQIYAQLPIAKKELDPIIDALVVGERVDSVPIYFHQIVRPSVQPFLISWMKYNPTEEIAKLNIPVAIVQGTTDLQVSQDEAEKLHSAYPSSKLIIVDGMNHIMKKAPMDRMENMATYSDPDLPLIDGFSDRIIEFINSVNN